MTSQNAPFVAPPPQGANSDPDSDPASENLEGAQTLQPAPSANAGLSDVKVHQAQGGMWHRLYVWTWIATLSVIGFTLLGLKTMPLHGYKGDLLDRVQVSVQVDRLLAILRGQVVPTTEGEAVVSMIPSLLESTEIYGMLPVRAADGNSAWRAYRARVPLTSGRGKIVVIVADLGLDDFATERAIDLPPAVTLEFSPYGRSLTRWALFAREKGHELLLSLPLEGLPESGIDAGDLELAQEQGAPETLHRLKSVLGRMTGYVGVTGGNPSSFFNNLEASRPVLRDISSRGLLFLAESSRTRQALSYARSLRMPTARLDTTFSEAQTREEIDERLRELTARARRSRSATIVRFAPLPTTLNALSDWLVALDDSRGYQVIPLTAVFAPSSGRQRSF